MTVYGTFECLLKGKEAELILERNTSNIIINIVLS